MKFTFDIQRFAVTVTDGQVTIPAGETYTLDGVTYTAASSGATLNLDGGKVSGIASGSVTATTSNSDAKISFDASDGAINFTATADGKNVTVKQRFPIEFISGEFAYKGNKLTVSAGSTLAIIGTNGNYSLRNENTFVYGGTYTFTNTGMTTESQSTISVFTLTNGSDVRKLQLEQRGKVVNTFGERGFTLTKGSSEVVKLGNYTLTATATNDAALNIVLDAKGLTLVPRQGDGTLNVKLERGDTTVLAGELECTSGEITFGYDNAVTFAKGTSFNFTQGDYVLTATATDDAGGKFSLGTDGISFTPDKNDGALDITLKKNGQAIFDSSVNVSDGTITFDPTTQKISFTDGTKISLAFDGYELNATVKGNASVKAVADGKGNFTITPDTGDGSLDMTLKSSKGSMSANVEVLSGSFIFGIGGKLTVTKGTELKLDFGGGYVVNFKATDDAGGLLSLDTDGFSFTPNSADGGLELSITRNGETRTASLDVTGTVTYKLDGSISLTKGTVVKNKFADGNALTITATTDASGSIVFAPNDGLTITPSTPNALDVLLSRDGTEVIEIAGITGSVNYKGGTFTASDGTELYFVDPAGYYHDNVLRTSGGTTSLNFNSNGIIYTANKGATFTMDYLQGTTWNLQNGAITDHFSGLMQGLLSLSDGSNFVTNDNEFPFTLEQDGNYMLNGIKVITSSELVDALFTNYDTVTVNEIAYTALDDNVTLTTDGTSTTVSGGKVTMQKDGFDKSLNFDTTKGSVSHVTEGEAYLISTAADLQALAQRVNDGDDCTGLTFKLTGDIDMRSIANFTPIGTDANKFNGTFDGGCYTIRNLTINHPDDNEQALFGNVGNGSVIKNVNLVNAAVTGKDDVGGLVGDNGGKILNCTVNNGTITGTNNDIGGIAGENDGTILSCAATNTTVKGKYSVGGLVGNNDGSIIISYAISPTVSTDIADADYGAVVGDNSGTIKAYCYDCDEPTVGKNTGASPEITFVDKAQIDGLAIGKSARNDAGTFTVAAGTKCYINRDNQVTTFTAPKKISVNHYVDGGISYFDFDGDITANVSVTSGGQTVFAGDLKLGGVISCNPKSGTFGLTGGNSSHGDGTNTFAQLNLNGYEIKMSTNDTTVVVVPEIGNGKVSLNFPNTRKDEMLFTISKDGNTLLNNQLIISGTIGMDIASQEVSLTKGTVLTIIGDHENSLEITALDDASGNLTFTDAGIRFAPNAGDGQLELNFVTTDRKANIDVTAGAIILKNDRTLALEKGTVVNLTWTDGTSLKLTASDTGGSIGFDAQGLKISSNGELSIDLTTATGVQTTLSNLEGTIHYNAGKALFGEDAKLTATSTLGGQPVDITLESNGTGGYIEVSATGTKYVAGTGALEITWSRGDKSSTFAISNGEIFIGHGIFQIAEGTELSTDLKDLVPALYFTTTDAGTYVINGQTVTTSAENISMTATDNQMSFNLREGDEVSVNGMTFKGAGDVIITADAVTVGDGVTATGFDAGKTFVLYEKGSVTVDEKIFELTEDVPSGISVTGADDGFIFSRTITAESEERFGIKDSKDIGKIFTERFICAGDSSYRVQTDLVGLQQIIGVSDGASVTAAAAFDGVPEETVFDIVTDSTGNYTVGRKTYAVGGDSNVAIKADFEPKKTYVRGFDSLNGTASGDFTEHGVSIDGGNPIKIYGDKDVTIANSSSGVELFNLSDGAILADTGGASKAHTDTEGAFVFGEGEGDSIGVTVQGDPNVTFEFNLETQYVTNIANIEGNLIFSDTSNMCSINGIGGVFSGTFSSVGAFDNRLYLHDVADGSSLTTGDAEKIWLQQVGASMAVNTNEFNLANDADGVWIRDREVVGLDEGASLQVSQAGNYTVNGATLTAKAGDVIVGLGDSDAYIYDANHPLITKNTSTDEIVDFLKPENISVVGASAGGRFDISLTGGDLAIVENTAAQVKITAGDDTVVSQGKNVDISLTGGNTWLFALGGKMTLHDYNPSTGTGFGTTYKDIASAVENGSINFELGKLSIGDAVADFGTTTQLVNFFDRVGTRQIVGFAEHDMTLNASGETANLLLVADNYSTVTGGAGNDTILADVGSFVDAGAGNNFIELATERNANDAGTTIDITNGNHTIANFKAGFDRSSDMLANDDSMWFSTFDGTNVTVETDNGKTILSDIGDGESFVKIKTSEGDGVRSDVAIAQKNSVIASGDEIANIYVGNNSGVDFTGFETSLLVDLTDDAEGFADGKIMYFYGINSVTAGDGQSTLMGSTDDETLTGGKGNSSLWSNAGDDVMIGSSGTTKFFFDVNDGRDVIKNFNFDTDSVNIFANTVTSVTSDASGNVVVQINGGDDYLTIEDAAGKNFRFNDLVANVDRNLTYNDAATQFVATGVDATLTVNESAEIWLDNAHGKFYDGDIAVIDATASTGEMILAGNDRDNTILAGDGDASLWGGNGGNDLLVGGGGRNIFFYNAGNGSDTVTGANDGDIVDLTNITLAQISTAEISSGGVTLNFVDGGKLNVEGTAAVDFRINGETYTADYSSATWSKK